MVVIGTEVNNVNTQRFALAANGYNASGNTAALAFGGEAPPKTGATEEWNGTNWTEVAR